MKGKIFARQEADRMIPLLRRIILNVRAHERLIFRKRRKLSNLAAGDGARRGSLRRALTALDQEQVRFTEELEDLGCILRDRRQGVVECFGELEGEIVYFTWRPGSDSFDHWHSLDSSPTSARPLPATAATAE